MKHQFTEVQTHATLQDALNRAFYRLPPFSWMREVRMGASRLDLVAYVHTNRVNPRALPGFHVIEAKMPWDRDPRRLARQLADAYAHGDFVWLAVVDADPRRVPTGPRTGLFQYDLAGDKVTLWRRPLRNRPQFHQVRRTYTKRLGQCLARIRTQYPDLIA